MVDSYAWGAPGGILHGASELTGALLGYPVALEQVRQRREAFELQKAEAERQRARQEIADAFALEDRAIAAQDREQRRKAQEFADLYEGRIEPEGLHPELPLTTPQQHMYARGMKEREMKEKLIASQLAENEAQAAARIAAANRPPEVDHLTRNQAWQRALELGQLEAGVDANGKPLLPNPERVRAIFAELLPSASMAPAAAPAAAEAFLPPVARPAPRAAGAPLRGPRAAREASPAAATAPPSTMQDRADIVNRAQPYINEALQRYEAHDDEGTLLAIRRAAAEAGPAVAQAVQQALIRISQQAGPGRPEVGFSEAETQRMFAGQPRMSVGDMGF